MKLNQQLRSMSHQSKTVKLNWQKRKMKAWSQDLLLILIILD